MVASMCTALLAEVAALHLMGTPNWEQMSISSRVLDGRPGDAPAAPGLQLPRRLGLIGRSVLDAVPLIQHHPQPLHLRAWAGILLCERGNNLLQTQ